MRKVLRLIVVLILVLGLTLPIATSVSADSTVAELWAANGKYKAGDVRVWNDATTLFVQFTTWDWLLVETHVAVGWYDGTDWVGIPMTKKGNPKVGNFPYSQPHDPVVRVTYEIPLSWAPGTELRIAAHAVVRGSCGDETAWAGDISFPWKSWATYFTYIVQ